MDEITNVTEEMATTDVLATNTSTFDKALPIAGGFLVGLVVGFLIDRFAVKPLIEKANTKKEAKPVEEVKTEE